jgi:hypothetical protein
MSKKTVKLSPKELEVLSSLEKQKQDLATNYQNQINIINTNESIVLQLIMEKAKITEQPSSINIEKNSLVFEFAKKAKVADEAEVDSK